MMLDVDALKQELLDATYQAESPAVAIKKLDAALKGYFEANTVVNFIWTAVDPQSKPDPMTAPKGKITGLSFNIGLSQSTSKAQSDAWISLKVQAGFLTGLYNITDSGFSTSTGSMATFPPMSLKFEGDSRDAVFRLLAEGIIDAVKAYKPAIPCSGTHGAFVGSGIVESFT